jgi:hypothetical protein
LSDFLKTIAQVSAFSIPPERKSLVDSGSTAELRLFSQSLAIENLDEAFFGQIPHCAMEHVWNGAQMRV